MVNLKSESKFLHSCIENSLDYVTWDVCFTFLVTFHIT